MKAQDSLVTCFLPPLAFLMRWNLLCRVKVIFRLKNQ